MKRHYDYRKFRLKTDTDSDRFWIDFGNDDFASKLVFLGKHFWSKQSICLPHVHSTYQVTYILGGKGSYVSGGIEYKVEAGDIFIAEPNTEHEGKSHPDAPFELFFFGYDFNPKKQLYNVEFIKNIDEIFLKFFDNYTSLTHRPVIRDNHQMGITLEKLVNEVNATLPFREDLIRAYLHELFVLLIRNIMDYIDISKMDLSYIDPVLKAKEYIRSRYQEQLTLTDIAQTVSLSDSYFVRLFKKTTSLTPMEYLNKIRIEHAKRYLLFSNQNITEIADLVGFSSVHYFSSRFKKEENISPLLFRKTSKLEKNDVS